MGIYKPSGVRAIFLHSWGLLTGIVWVKAWQHESTSRLYAADASSIKDIHHLAHAT